MLNLHVIKRRLVQDDPPEILTPTTRVVEVHMTDGGSAWVLVDGVDLDDLKGAIHSRRLLCGRLVGGAGVNGRGVLIPADQIQMVVDVDG
ncbi:hypothetical protein [Brevundimonas naejangsanensis]|uniref:hypothetical protein n=1 Tax=Brevundimonas naejangsanensis TaxID=588932 RepID=UPI00106B90BE|nr:hypothetical protein [Brevundimonas naejangsanensis]QBQ49556.1 hypothetical protein E3U41_13195 [Brevundimonas naejangsanensis]